MSNTHNPFLSLEQRLEVIELKLDALQHGGKFQQEQDEVPIDAREAATHLGIALPTLYNKLSRGEITGHKRGKKLMFFRSELNEWLRDQA